MKKSILIENEGALFRGPSVGIPREVWNPGSGWTPYKGETPKPEGWGSEISETEASALMAERNARHSGKEKKVA